MSNLNIHEYSQLKRVVASYIDRYSTPTREENRKNLESLASLKTKTDPESIKEVKKLRDRLILCNGGFGMKYVLKYHNLLNNPESIEDLFQEAIIGLAEAIDAFDITRNVSFTTYAFFHVKKRMIDFIKKNKLIKAPRDIAKNLKNVNIIVDKFFSEHRHRPSTLEVRKELKKQFSVILDVSTIENILLLLDLNSCSMEDSFIVEFSDQACTPSQSTIVSLMKSAIEKELSKLPELDQKRLRLRFGLDGSPLSPNEIELMFGELNG